MFDNLKSPAEDGENISETKRPETPLGQSNNIPSNLASTFGANLGSGEAMNTRPANQGLGEEFDNRMQKLSEKGKKRGIRFSRMGIIVSAVIGLIMMGAGYYIFVEVIGITEKANESAINVDNIGRTNGSRDRAEEAQAKPALTATMTACELDEDCIIVQADCCDCENGGVQIGLNKDFADAWKTEIENKCADVTCPTISQCSPGRAFCDNLVCNFLVEEAPIASSTDDMMATSTEACVGDTCPLNSGTVIDEGQIVEPVDIGSTGNPNLVDSDSDGIFDVDEVNIGTDPTKPDTDEDRLSDSDELRYKTNPLNSDTDGDGFGDGDEVVNGYNPLGGGLLNQ